MSQSSYRLQLGRLVRSLATANQHAQLESDLSQGSLPGHVKLFVDGNLEKRLDKLSKQLEFVAVAFEDFEALIIDYIRAQPLAAFDTGCGDGNRMLAWLLETRRLTAVQRDYVACQRARHRIEQMARAQRLKYLRFQELYSLSRHFLPRLAAGDELQVMLNPIRTWTRFETPELLDDDASPPMDVLCFAITGKIAAAVLQLEGQALLNELADYQPCTLSQWAAVSSLADRQQLLELCQELAEMGLVGFG